MQSPSASSITDWFATAFSPCTKRPEDAEACFGEWLEARLEAERQSVLEDMQSQWQARHRALHSEILAAVHKSLLAQQQQQQQQLAKDGLRTPLAKDGPRTPRLPPPPAPVTCPPTPDVLKPKLPLVHGSPVGLVVDLPPGSPMSAPLTFETCGTPISISEKIKEVPCEASNPETSSRESGGVTTCDRWQRIEVFFGIIIGLNAFVLLVEEQVKGIGVGFDLGVSGFSKSAQDLFPGASIAFYALNVFFSVMFTLELVCRLHHRKLQFYRYPWILLDLIVVPLAWIDIFGASVVPSSVLRTFRVLRLFELIHSMEYFDKLYLLIRSIKASFGALFWSLVLIFFTQVVAALWLHCTLSGFYEDQSKPAAVRQQIFQRFGTTSRTLLTMFQVVFASWTEPCWMLVLNVSEWYGLCFVLYRCVLGFSLVKVVSSMFIAETNRICQSDKEIAALKKNRAAETHKKQLRDLFSELDKSGDGNVSWDEFQQLLVNPKLVKWAEDMGINHMLLEELFGVLKKRGRGEDGHEVFVELEEFVSAAVKVDGAARSIDILALANAVEEIKGKLAVHEAGHENPFQSFLGQRAKTVSQLQIC